MATDLMKGRISLWRGYVLQDTVCVCMYHLGFDGCKFHVSCQHTRSRMKEMTVLPDDQSLRGNEEQRKALPTGGRDVGPSL